MRVIFINLHGNEMLVKTMNKFIFKQSVAIKHKYLLDYLLQREDIEVCSYVNEKGFSLVSNLSPIVMKFLNLFRFIEHRIVLRKNGIPRKKITLLRHSSDITEDDIVIVYRHSSAQLYGLEKIKAYKAVSMIHFFGTQEESKILEKSNINVMFNESDLSKHSAIFQKYYSWYENDFIVHPFVYEERFQNVKPFYCRKNMAFATGTITYKTNPEFLEVYGDSCDQPSRKQIKDNEDSLRGLICCTSRDYAEDSHPIKTSSNKLIQIYKSFHYKAFESQQKKYYSFDMVESFNNYKMCVVGEEILGVPGIGFVEGMACGCAYIGQKVGYYEAFGMKEGVHYIGYNGTIEDLKAKISYYKQPEHQEELERIANAGCEFARANFSGRIVAEKLIDSLIKRKEKRC